MFSRVSGWLAVCVSRPAGNVQLPQICYAEPILCKRESNERCQKKQ
jgi:hypothetical protein